MKSIRPKTLATSKDGWLAKLTAFVESLCREIPELDKGFD